MGEDAGRRLLLLEGDPDLALSYGVSLGMSGYDVNVESEPRRALDTVRSGQCDIVVVDAGGSNQGESGVSQLLRSREGQPISVVVIGEPAGLVAADAYIPRAGLTPELLARQVAAFLHGVHHGA